MILPAFLVGLNPLKNIKVALFLIGALGAGITVWVVVHKWYSMKNTIVQLESDKRDLEIEKQGLQQHLEQQMKDIKAQEDIRLELAKRLYQAQQNVDAMENKFNKVSRLLGERDIGKLAQARPKDIQKIVNKGTANMLRCFEISSGQPLTESEKTATKPSQSNTMCPSIANPNLQDKLKPASIKK